MDSLTNLGQMEADFERRKRLQAEVLASIKRFRARDRLKRDELHDRNQSRREGAKSPRRSG